MKFFLIIALIFKSKLLECFSKDSQHSVIIEDLKLLKKTGFGLFPDEYFLDLFEFGKNFSGIYIKSDEYIAPSASHYLNGKLRSISFEQNKDHQIYHDKNSQSFATVYFKENNFKIYARFFDNQSNLHFDLIPYLKAKEAKNTHLFIKRLDDNRKRSLFNGKKVYLTNDQLYAPDSKVNLKEFKNLENYQLVKQAQGQKPVILDVETLLILDPSVYKNHKAFLNSTNEAEIFEHMRRYYSHVFNGVNQKYQNSFKNDPDLKINIILVHILIMTNSSDATWTDVKIVGDSKIKEYLGKEVILPKTLDELHKFVERQKFKFEFDHVVGLCDKDLWIEDDTEPDEIRSSLLGLAWMSQVCNTSLKYSVAEDNIGFANLYIIAHEIGHNLGSAHDGVQDYNYCLADDDYIMSPVASYEKITNKQLFSFCSISFFKQALLLDDGSDRSSCLFNRAKIPSFVQSANYEQTGQIWSLDQQCKIQYGHNSIVCQNTTLQALSCSQLFCEIIGLDGICASQVPAVEGSYCGENKLCRKGVCTSFSTTNSLSKLSHNFVLLLISLFFIFCLLN